MWSKPCHVTNSQHLPVLSLPAKRRSLWLKPSNKWWWSLPATTYRLQFNHTVEFTFICPCCAFTYFVATGQNQQMQRTPKSNPNYSLHGWEKLRWDCRKTGYNSQWLNTSVKTSVLEVAIKVASKKKKKRCCVDINKLPSWINCDSPWNTPLYILPSE